MRTYLNLMQHVLDHGTKKSDRTGTGTTSVFGYQMRFNLAEGFPLVTTKKCHMKSIVHELLWFLQGDTNIKYLKDNGIKIWDEWADENGNLGPVYGKQWRSWTTVDGRVVDQIKMAVDQIKGNPDSRRIIVRPGTSANSIRWRWHPAMRSSSFTWPTANCPVSCTSAARISFSACRSTSLPTRC